MKVGTCNSKKGKITSGKLKTGMYNEKPLEIPIKIAQGKKEGKTIFISAGIHGNEINGMYLLSQISQVINPTKLTGTIILLPVINTPGFEQRKRYVPEEETDINRAFPGNKTIAGQIAKTIFDEVVSKSEFGIDCHDSGYQRVLLPHARIFKKKYGITDELGSAFGTEIIMTRHGKKGMLALEAYKKKKVPVLTIEVGGGDTINKKFIQTGIRGIRNILAYQGMINEKIQLPETQLLLSERKWYPAKSAGILDLKVDLGQNVSKGDELAKIYNPTKDKSETIKAKYDGVVLSTKHSAWIRKKEETVSLMHFEKEGKKSIKPLEGKLIQNYPNIFTKITKSLLLDNFLQFKGITHLKIQEKSKRLLTQIMKE